jgi:hypothetical protein
MGKRRAEPPITRTVILDENTRRVPSQLRRLAALI